MTSGNWNAPVPCLVAYHARNLASHSISDRHGAEESAPGSSSTSNSTIATDGAST